MPRKARIDAAGALHHIIVRGIERRKIFWDDADRDSFVKRLGQVLTETQTDCFAWALIPNHAHLCAAYGSYADQRGHEKAFDGICRSIQSAPWASWPCFSEPIQVDSLPGGSLFKGVRTSPGSGHAK